MAYELVRTIIQKVLQDKILLGLVVICILGLFVGGLTMGDDKPDAGKKQEEAAAPGAEPAAASAALTPDIARDFVSYWLAKAMDYNAATANPSHQEAMSWMTPEAAGNFQNMFWTPQISESVSNGRLVAAFQPTSVQAQAVNPDGSVVIGVAGQMVVQTGAQPTVQQFSGSFLVRQDKDGLRVAGLDARTGTIPGSSVY